MLLNIQYKLVYYELSCPFFGSSKTNLSFYIEVYRWLI